LCPYDKAIPGSAEDVFNRYVSHHRIMVECAFEEFVMHWGIFWRPLVLDFYCYQGIIEGDMRLHNLSVMNAKKVKAIMPRACTIKIAGTI
jgi:hypothetical protein